MTERRIDIIYRIDRPCAQGTIEIYGDPDMGWYEARTLENGEVIRDTGRQGSFGMQYGSAAIALRDALNHDEPPQGATPTERTIDVLDDLVAELKGTDEKERLADILRETMDEIYGGGRWPTGETLPLTFICGVQINQDKGRLWDNVAVIEGEKHGYVAAVLDVDGKWHEGWRGDTWAEAFAAIGAALDVSGTEILERELAEARQKLEALQPAIDAGDQGAQNDARLLREHEAAIVKRLEAGEEGA
ncbi:hypothetical protein NFH98_20950 [Halomonas sp. H33-56]|uniref:hypothetical protein n=1 Tax=Halomonas sp. H33-56 TaxID=2950873 RepID=UPI0032DFB6A4